MSYKIAHFATVYDPIIQNIGLDDENYAFSELEDIVYSKHINNSVFYKNHLENQGHKCLDIWYNVPQIQRKWADANLSKKDNSNIEIIIERLSKFNPDILFIENIIKINSQVREQILNALPKKPIVVGWHFVSPDLADDYTSIDLILTGNKDFVFQFSQMGLKAEYWPIGFESTLLNRLTKTEAELPFNFSGGLGQIDGKHKNRFELIQYLLDKTNLNCHSLQIPVKGSAKIKNYIGDLIYGLGLAKLPGYDFGKYLNNSADYVLFKKFSAQILAAEFGIDYLNTINNSAVNLNVHIDAVKKHGGNMRLFEVTGVGSCLLTDKIKNMHDFFVEDSEVVTYANKEEAFEKYLYLSKNPEMRKEIAHAGQLKTLKSHNLEERVERLNTIFRDLLKTTHA